MFSPIPLSGVEHYFPQILRRCDAKGLKRLVCKHLFENADADTQSKIRFALIERTLANTMDATPMLRQKLLGAPADLLSVMELALPCTPSATWPLKRDHAAVEAADVGVQGAETPTRPAKMRKLIKTPQLARWWERRDGSECFQYYFQAGA
jgi:hypothetical protein